MLPDSEPGTSHTMEFSDTASESTMSSQSSFESESWQNTSTQNRDSWPNLAMISERYQLSDRASAAIANAVLSDVGIITNSDKSSVIDRSKLRRERNKYREIIRKKEDTFFELVDAIFTDGRKDATMMVEEGENGIYYRKMELEEHYVVVGQPGEFYLTHLSPENGQGLTIANAILNSIKGTKLEKNLSIIGTDGTASMTGSRNGFIRCLEELLGRPLQWDICLLHCNELPLRHLFVNLDGTTTGPDSFSGPIGKKLNENVTNWPIQKFKQILNQNFPILSNDVLLDLSTDQHYGYRICLSIMLGHVDADLALLQIGPIVHSRWLTLACRILRFYVSTNKPSNTLATLAEFCLKIYFPTWFDIKHKNKITHGSKIFYTLIKRIQQFPNINVRTISLKVLQRNAYFAHHENVLLGMLADDNEEIRRIAVNKILSIRRNITYIIGDTDEFDGGYVEQQGDTTAAPARMPNSTVRRFLVPKINIQAKAFYKLINLNQSDIGEPPAIRNLTDDAISEMQQHPLNLQHPCHNQAVERHVKLVTDASSSVAGYDKRDGMIRQMIRSRKLMKTFDTKQQFMYL